jgi:poly(glycerol-phosphate) alpha-glucosyltransferase
MEKKYFFLIEDLGEKRTGIETSTLNRSRLFMKFLGINPIIITVKYNPKLNKQRRDLIRNGLLLSEVKIINMYEYFQETVTELRPNYAQILNKLEGLEYKNVQGTLDYRISQNGELITYRKCDDEGTLLFNNIFMEHKKVRRDWYDSNGYLSKTQILEPERGHTITEVYYRTDGTVCLQKYFKFPENKSILMGIHFLDKNGNIIKIFKTESELMSYWFSIILSERYLNLLVIDKERVFYEVLSKIKGKHIKLICAIHSSHLANGQDLITGKINSNYKPIFEDLKIPDAIVVLTELQKKHIVQRFGEVNNMHVIPHTLEVTPDNVPAINRTPKKIVYLGRFAEEKQLEHLIAAFRKVVDHYPDATLDLYGYGSLEEGYKKQIIDSGLTNNVFIKGFTSNIEAVYNSASLVVLTSKVEGFSLFLLESIAHGCPVISYDINYSPSDIIDQGKNGYLVQANNIEELADRMISYFYDPDLLKKMSEASYNKFKEFSPEIVAEKWSSLLSSIGDGY